MALKGRGRAPCAAGGRSPRAPDDRQHLLSLSFFLSEITPGMNAAGRCPAPGLRTPEPHVLPLCPSTEEPFHALRNG